MIGGGRTFPKLSHLGGGGVSKILLKRGDNPEKWEGVVDIEMGGGGLPLFVTLQFSCIYCLLGEKVKFPFLHSFELFTQDSHPSLYSTKKLYHLHISDSF